MIQIGDYKIEWVNEDYLKVSYNFRSFTREIMVCGGDMETLLSCLHINTEKNDVKELNKNNE